ncbi:MAG: SRPBCC domain-containing protein [Acidobacteriota bacterium]
MKIQTRILAGVAGALLMSAVARGEEVRNTSFVASGGERVLRQEYVVAASREEVWKTMTTSEGLRSFLSPNALVELKTGGRFDSNYRIDARLSDPDTIHNTVLAYLPLEMFAIRVGLTDFFPKGPRDAGTLFSVLTLHDAGQGRTKMVESMAGFGTGPEWDTVYAFFEKGNAYEFLVLEKRFREGPTDWSRKPAVPAPKTSPRNSN